MSSRLAPVALLCLVLLACAGCSDATDPPAGTGSGSGTIDPGAGTFVLKSAECELPGGGSCTVALVGSGLVLDEDGVHVEITVALRNDGRQPLAAPVTVVVSDFVPPTTWPVNGELPILDPAGTGPVPDVDGWYYDEELGEDRILDPGELSGGKTWRFRTEDQGPFSFATGVHGGEPPAESAISGFCFWDENRNGVRDDGDWPLPGFVRVVAPDSSVSTLATDRSGHYEYPVHVTGLHVLRFDPLIDTMYKDEDDGALIAPIAFSTPNPLHVLITPGLDGAPRGFHDAHFGAYIDMPPAPQIQFTDVSVDSLHNTPWQLLRAQVLEHNIMSFEIGFSGCQPLHDFTLWMSGGILESNPPQADIVLVHMTAEDCDMAMRGGRLYDLWPLAERFLQGYGPGTLLLNVHDYYGGVQQLEWRIDQVSPAG